MMVDVSVLDVLLEEEEEEVVVLVGNNCNNFCNTTFPYSVVILFCAVNVKL